MSWRDELVDASFRGVPFQVTDLDLEEGRRIVADDSPETDDLPQTVDLGRARPSFSVEGFVTGRDYLDKRDALRAALNRAGPGELVLPWRTRALVRVGRVRWRHDVGGGYCAVSFECVEHGGEPLLLVVTVAPSTTLETAAVVEVAKASAEAAPFSELAPTYRNQVARALALVPFTWSALLEQAALEAQNDDAVKDLVGAEGLAVDAFVEAMATVDDVGALLELVRNWPLGSPRYTSGPASTPSEARARGCIETYFQTLRLVAICRACDVAIAASYSSADAAEARMGSLSDALAAELEDPATSSTTFAALVNLRGALVEGMVNVAERLPRLRPMRVPAPTPALVLAFDTFGAEQLEQRAGEIINLNGVLHPGFVVGLIDVLEDE